MTWEQIVRLLGNKSAAALREVYEEPGDFLFGAWRPAELSPIVAEKVDLLRRLSHHPGSPIRGPEDLYSHVAYLGAKDQEVFVVLFLDGQNRVLGGEEMFRGTGSGVTVSTRVLFQRALGLGASGLFVAHNHPAGVLTASPEDDRCTRRLLQAGKLMGIPLVDHIIVGRGTYYSYRKDGKILPRAPKERGPL